MDSDNIRSSEKLVLLDQFSATFGGALDRQVLAPSDHLHAEGPADPRHRAADIAKAEHAERPSRKVVADKTLPTATTQRGVLGDDVARTGKDERPGQFDRRG